MYTVEGTDVSRKENFFYTAVNVYTNARILGELPKLVVSRNRLTAFPLWLLEQGHKVRTEGIVLLGSTVLAYRIL